MIQTPGRISYANLSGIPIAGATTDPSGIARFDWIPARLEQGLGFVVIDEVYHCPERPRLLGNDSTGHLLTARVFRKARMAGSVVHQDGTPAAGILIQVEGRGATSNYFRGFARTDRDGRYELNVDPNQSYIASIISEEWGAPAQAGLSLGEGDRRAGVDFRLSRGTVIRGVVTVGAEFEPAAAETVTLIQQDKLVRWAITDESGSYQFRVGPGVYELRLPHSIEHEKLTIAGLTEPDVTRDYHAPRRSRGPLVGQILRDDGRPEVNALIVGGSIDDPRHGSFDAVCGASGQFQVERWRDEMLVYARSRDGMRAGFTHVSAESDELEMRTHPAGAAFGVVLGSDGTPVQGARLSCRIDIPGIDLAHPIVFRTRTDARGRFEFGGLVVGARCSTSTYHGPEDTRTAGPEQPISAPVRYDLGAITIVTSNQN